ESKSHFNSKKTASKNRILTRKQNLAENDEQTENETFDFLDLIDATNGSDTTVGNRNTINHRDLRSGKLKNFDSHAMDRCTSIRSIKVYVTYRYVASRRLAPLRGLSSTTASKAGHLQLVHTKTEVTNSFPTISTSHQKSIC